MPQELNLMLWVIIAIIGVLVAFVIWNMAETDAKRAAYYNILGPSGVLGGIACMKGMQSPKKKGTVTSVLTSAEGIIIMTIFIAIVITVMIVFFGGAGKTSSELSFGLFDFVFS